MLLKINANYAHAARDLRNIFNNVINIINFNNDDSAFTKVVVET